LVPQSQATAIPSLRLLVEFPKCYLSIPLSNHEVILSVNDNVALDNYLDMIIDTIALNFTIDSMYSLGLVLVALDWVCEETCRLPDPCICSSYVMG